MFFRRVTIPLACNYEKFLQSLSTEVSNPAFHSNDDKLFAGSINDGRFKIWPIQMIRGLEAITYGRYEIAGNKGFLQLFMRVSIPVALSSVILYAYIVFQIISSGYDSYWFIPLIAPIVVCIVSFFPAAIKTETKLKEIIKELEEH